MDRYKTRSESYVSGETSQLHRIQRLLLERFDSLGKKAIFINVCRLFITSVLINIQSFY